MVGRLWTKLLCIKWHQFARGIAVLVLVDQWLGPVGGIPPSEAIVVVALGAIFAPVPSSHKKSE